jgi:hypothetical protein
MKCRSCGKKFDSSMDFVEDYEMCEALSYITDSVTLCSECSYALMDAVHEFAHNFVNKKEK